MSRAVSTNPFFYTASKRGGGRSMGFARARSRRALADQLRRDRLVLLGSWKLPGWLGSGEPELSLGDHASFNEQLAQLVSRGVPLVDALEVAATVVKPASGPRVERIRELVRAGSGFADACAKVGSFDDVTIAVYRAAERTGDLPGACAQLARGAQRQKAVRGKAATLMIYPAIVLSISVIVGLLMLTLILPMIADSLREAGMELPWITSTMLAAGLFLRKYWFFALIVVAAAVVGAVLGRQALGGVIGAIARRLPLMRDVVRAQEWARFFTVMAAMTRSGVPLADALGTATDVLGDPMMRRDLSRLRTRLIEGGVLRTLLDGVESLPLATRRLLVAADQAGDLETAFDNLANDYAEELDRRTERMMAGLEPALIIVMFLIIGSMILAIMAPLIKATTSGI